MPRSAAGAAYTMVAPHIARIPHRIVNSYLIDDPESGAWVLVDAGLKTSARHIIRAAEERFGAGAAPAAIVLTHGHFDHVGALQTLLEYWANVLVYAHRLEMPYLTGRSSYPPADPAVGGGMMAVMSRVFTRGPIDITGRVRLLPEDGTIPHLPSWRWLPTPGHSPGHVSLYNERERALVAGDAFVTTRQESATAVLTQRVELNGPPAYFTPDWRKARQSVRMLAALGPRIAATGHGVPMFGAALRKELNALALRFGELGMPKRGRYVREPAVMDETGVKYVPPPLPRIWPKYAAASIGGAAVLMLLWRATRRRRRLA